MSNHNEDKTNMPIAIVGVGGLFPGSLDAVAFWNHILRATDLITDIPKTHWSVAHYSDADALKRDPKDLDKTYARRGGFLPEVVFDPLKEGMPPNLLSSTDTSQLLGVMVARATLDDCLGKGALAQANRDRISCLLGVTSGQELFGQMAARLSWPQWIAGMRAAGIDEDAAQQAAKKIAETFTPWTEASFPGLLGNVVAGRIMNRLDLHGTNAVTDAACASSFAAISMAIDELKLGRADIVLTGGVDTINDIFMYMCFTKTPALSASGECRPFDAASDGTLLGEGLGMVALKRLSDAERDGNQIYAVIKGLGTSSDGKSKSIYAPVSEGQAMALRRAYDAAGYSPRTVELVEAHGTGTKAGDVAELGGLRQGFGPAAASSDDTQWCALGTVKSQIGHTKAAAGAAGLIKAALALHEKVLPPTAKISTPNPQADFDTSPFYVSGKARPWIRSHAHPRRAGVSSFGFGGSNFHITLEEYTGPQQARRMRCRDVELFALRAGSDALLKDQARALQQQLDAGLAAAAARCRTEADEATGDHRAAFVASTIDEAKRKLDAIAGGTSMPGVFVRVAAQAPQLACLFPGQGSQRVNMMADVVMEFAAARDVLDHAAHDNHGLMRTIYPPPAYDAATTARQTQALTATTMAQPALGVTSMAMWAVLQQFGVRAQMMGGHSFGELSALCAAGAMSTGALLEAARVRGQAMAQAGEGHDGAMAAVLGKENLRTHLHAALQGTRVVLANDNAPEQVVIAGPRSDVEQVCAKLQAQGLNCKMLPVATAFHSPIVAAARAPLLAHLQQTPMHAPHTPVFSNVTAALHGDVDSMRVRLAEQVEKPVRFVEQVRAMADAGATVFLEVGAGSVLTGLVKRIAPDVTAIATDGEAGVSSLLQALAQLFVAAVPLHLQALAEDAARALPVSPSKGQVVLTGSNVGKPAWPAPVTKPAPAPVAAAPVAAAPVAAAPVVAAPIVAAPVPPKTPSLPFVKSPTVVQPMTQSSSWISALQSAQEATAQAHMSFQRALSEAHQAYLRSSDEMTRMMHAAANGLAVPAATAPVMHAPQPQPQTLLAPVASVTPAPSVSSTVHAPVVPASQAKTVAREASSARSTLLAVVAEKTGYPADALHDDMNLEADLGIDSIKRVEILGALKEKVPAAAALDAMKLAQLRTLGEIAGALGGSVTNGVSHASSSNGAAAHAIVPSARAVATDASSPRATLLAVVAEKTGYPADALHDEMNLEADLGIDSIKRVEILGALKEKVPAAAALDAMKLAQLRTLGEIAGALGGAATSNGASHAVAAQAVAPRPISHGTNGHAHAVDVPSARTTLLAVVAEKTGYPADALHDDMNLEADLGIDSIKRVEILGALKEKVPAAAALDAMKLAQLRTLGEIAGALGGSSKSNGASHASSASNVIVAAKATGVVNGATSHTPNTAAMQLLQWELKPRVVRALPSTTGAVEIIVGGERSARVGSMITERLQADGVTVTTAPKPSGHAAGVVLLTMLDDAPVDAGLCDAVMHVQAAGPGLLAAAKRTGAFLFALSAGHQNNLEHAARGGIQGLLKTASLEWPQVACTSVNVDINDDARIAAAACAELMAGFQDVEVRLRGDDRYVPHLLDVSAAAPSLTHAKHGVWLFTGGARGITAACVQALVKHHKPRIALMGRTALLEETALTRDAVDDAAIKRALINAAQAAGQALSPKDIGAQAARILSTREVKALLLQLQQQGVQAMYVACDVSVASQVQQAVQSIEQRFGPITTLVHGAGVLADKRIEDKTADQVRMVLATKLRGLLHVMHALPASQLQQLLVFSSAAGRFGNVGQCDYAMANEATACVAECFAAQQPSASVTTFAWGAWAGGMVTPGLAKQFADRGVQLIAIDDGAGVFVQHALAAAPGVHQVVVGAPLQGDPAPASIWKISATTDAHLRDHSVKGVPVLPAAVVIDRIARVQPHHNAVLNVRVLRGVVLDNFPQGHELHMQANGHGVEVHHQGKPAYHAALGTMPTPVVRVPDLPAPVRASVYGGSSPLFHGAAFQMIERVLGANESNVVASLGKSGRFAWEAGTTTSPVLVDAALQLALWWAHLRQDGQHLPTAVRAVIRGHAVAPGTMLRAWLHGHRVHDHGAHADVWVVNDDNQVVLAVEGIEVHRLTTSASTTAADQRLVVTEP
jgi:acyl transferase domain-containing protein